MYWTLSLTLMSILVQVSFCQWQSYNNYLTYNEIYTYKTSSNAYINSGYFIQPSTSYTTANFITCTNPSTSYITLNKTYTSAQCYSAQTLSGSNYLISYDLYFQGTWSAETVQFTLGTLTYSFAYTSPTSYTLASKFCDSIEYDVKTINFTVSSTSSFSGNIKFTSSNTQTGQVSIRNFMISKVQCYPSCSQCTGPNKNECTSCYYGSVTNGVCPPCPSTLPYYMKQLGCKTVCSYYSARYADGFCQSYNTYNFLSTSFSTTPNYSENLKWALLYDPDNVDTSPGVFSNLYAMFGILKFKAGIYRFVSELSQFTYAAPVLIKMDITFFNPIPVGCGIQFKINNTYYGSIYMSSTGIQLHRVKLYETYSLNSYSTYSNCFYQELYLIIDIPQYQFLFSIIGNYTVATAGWGIKYLTITSGYCPSYCLLCEVAFKCKTCFSGYYTYRDGTCTSSCSGPYQQLSGSVCQDYDDETPYSKYLIQEYLGFDGDPTQYSKYQLISSNGTNFLKGSDIYYSVWQGWRIFGGPLVWAQAKFSRNFTISDPHHAITIGFQIIFGISFPSDGSFIYTIENKTPVTRLVNSYQTSYTDGKTAKVYERITHNIATLQIQWECFGPNNEPLAAYCGVNQFYIAVHYCQPYCLQCTDQNTCSLWNSTYNAATVKFSQSDCQSTEYFKKETYTCQPCPIQCITCISDVGCLTCQPTYTLTKLGCSCTYSQYQENNQCYNCPIECNQCLSSTYCIECLNTNNRIFNNGQCVCFDGYYPIVGIAQCSICNKFCQTCNGPTQNECLTCKAITNIQQTGSTCQCPAGAYYEELQNSCLTCHYSCKTCFATSINSCLTCDSSLNRIIKGLQCKCKPGFQEVNQVCTACPTIEDSTLINCYKNCNSSNQIWHTQTCSSCDSGFQLVEGECQPICGDSQILSYEQCEDGNTILNDKCYNCQYQCPLHCLTCDASTVIPCPDVCGDGMITGVEECEDGNIIPEDGCYQCKFQCQQACTKCVLGKCQECATKGWYLDPTVTPWICKERCGDGIIVGTEQCEDLNTSDLDGCKDCKYYCRLGCDQCNYSNNTCLSCLNPGFTPSSYYCQNICGDGIKAIDPAGYYTEQCDDGNTTNYDGCSSTCSYQCETISICTTCISNICSACATGFVLNSIKNRCDPVCQDGLLASTEICEDLLSLPYMCQHCQSKCQSSCSSCSTNGTGCVSCVIGYQLINNLCYSICGDKKVTNDEECDDGNLIPYDGCHFCKYNCQSSCSNCYKGNCLNCFDGYQLINFKCYQICGDGMLVGSEQCELNSQQNLQGNCNQCKFQCSANCQQCSFGICVVCNSGYELDFSFGNAYCTQQLHNVSILVDYCQNEVKNVCIRCQQNSYYDIFNQQCKLITNSIDVCEIFGDQNCQDCFQNCLECQNNHCIQCQVGYELNEEYVCKSICGDGILAEDEECEINDLNCQNCEYGEPKNCINYLSNRCFTCKKGFYYNEINNGCITNCGDNIVVGEEQCEDSNNIPYDGCYECKYSCDINCSICYQGQCIECQSEFILFKGKCIKKEESSQQECSFQCKLCQNDKCLECDEQYFLNEFNNCVKGCSTLCIDCQNQQCYVCQNGYKLQNNQCLLWPECSEGYYYDEDEKQCSSYCGDGIITYKDNCDNQNFDDVCYQYEHKCDQHCIECIDGYCLQCLKEYTLKDSQCYFLCQDSCINCIDGICTQCQNKYYLDDYFNCQFIDCSLNFSCQNQCGNGIIDKEEQCDDSNYIEFDTCNNQCELTCESNCEQCTLGKCVKCKQGWQISDFGCKSICGDQLVIGDEECDDGNNVNFDGCYECKYQCCQNCDICLKGICQQCLYGFDLDTENNLCLIKYSDEDQQVLPICKETVNKDCIECETGYLDFISNICVISDTNKCINKCTVCRNSKCLKCEYGYYGSKCQPKCGDGILAIEEECDDALQNNGIVCNNCKINCPQYCERCALGICTVCQQGYYLDRISNSCFSICGDSILATNEVCDDGNDMRYDGCFQCLFQCQIECLDCQFGKCAQCESPLILVTSKGVCEEQVFCTGLVGLYYDLDKNDCLPQCGDGIVAGSEQCDDSNNNKYDGCYECKYQCDQHCYNCQKGVCQECQIGYNLDGQKCNIICNDGLKLDDEECDDGNQIPRDGCTECKIDPNYKCQVDEKFQSYCFKCEQNCIECEMLNKIVMCKQCEKGYFLQDNTCNPCSEKCEECEKTPNNCKKCQTDDCNICEKNAGLYLDVDQKKCVSKCGDGVKTENEKCDDGNLIDQDGCNQNCEVEKAFECDSSGCHIPPKKFIEFVYKNQTATNEFILQYQDLNINICENLTIWIDMFNSTEFNYSVKKNLTAMTDDGSNNCEVSFSFFKTIDQSNLIHIIVPLVQKNDSRLIVEQEREIIIVPRKIVFYNAEQQAQAQTVASTSQTFTFLLQLIGPLTIVLGGFNFFWTILDILTWINNFYYLNIDYPLNVKIFFNKLQWGDIINIPDVISLNQPEDNYYFEAPVKFTEKGVNPLFMNNIQLFTALILLTNLAYFGVLFYIKCFSIIYKREIRTHKIEIFSINEEPKRVLSIQSPCKSQQKIVIQEPAPYILEYLYKEGNRFVRNFRAILISVINLVFLDICLACVLQLYFTKTQQYLIVKFNIFLAVSGIVFIASVLRLYSYVCSQHHTLYETVQFSNYYSVLYEGINVKSNMALKFCYLNIIRKALFIICTVVFYEIPLLQTTTCCLSSFINLALVAYQNPFENRMILVQTVLPDICIFIIIFITVFLAVHDVANIFTFDQKYFIGWLILGFIGLSIFVQLVFLFQQFFLDLKERIKLAIPFICKFFKQKKLDEENK